MFNYLFGVYFGPKFLS